MPPYLNAHYFYAPTLLLLDDPFLTILVEFTDEFAAQFLQYHGIYYKKSIDKKSVAETHEIAQGDERYFLEKGGDVEPEKNVYEMILDGSLAGELGHLKKESNEFSEKCADLEDRLITLHAKLNTRKTYNGARHSRMPGETQEQKQSLRRQRSDSDNYRISFKQQRTYALRLNCMGFATHDPALIF